MQRSCPRYDLAANGFTFVNLRFPVHLKILFFPPIFPAFNT